MLTWTVILWAGAQEDLKRLRWFRSSVNDFGEYPFDFGPFAGRGRAGYLECGRF